MQIVIAERPQTKYHPTYHKKRIHPVALVYPLLLLILTLVNVLVPQRSGVLALTQVFAPHLFFPLLLLLPFAFRRGAGSLRIALVACAIVYGVLYVPRLGVGSAQALPGAQQVDIMSWNMRVGNSYSRLRPILMRQPAAIVSLIEVDWRWVYDDDALRQAYPYQLSHPEDAAPSMALLSTYPILEHGLLDGPLDVWDMPRLMWARLDMGEGRTLVVFTAHPSPPHTFRRNCSFIHCYEPTRRDTRIASIRDYVEPYLESGEPFLLVGDFNVTEREPAYRDLVWGLQDAYTVAGAGLGNTWRPSQVIWQPLSLLRIDYQFSSPNVTPLRLQEDCAPRGSDHCIIHGLFELP